MQSCTRCPSYTAINPIISWLTQRFQQVFFSTRLFAVSVLDKLLQNLQTESNFGTVVHAADVCRVQLLNLVDFVECLD